MGCIVYTPPRAALRGWGSIGTPCVATPRELKAPHDLMVRERREKRERREGKERRGEEGGKNGG